MGKSEGSGKSDDKKESGGKSLNEQNWPGLLAITAFNLVVFAVVIATEPKWLSDLATASGCAVPGAVSLADHAAVASASGGASFARRARVRNPLSLMRLK